MTKTTGYAGTFLQSVQVILCSDSGMDQITMCKYRNVIKPDPFLCQLNLYSHPLTDFSGGNTSSLLDQGTIFLCLTAIYVWHSLKFALQKR